MRLKSLSKLFGPYFILPLLAILFWAPAVKAHSEHKTPVSLPQISETLENGDEVRYDWAGGHHVVRFLKSRIDHKRPVLRRKYHRLIEGEDDIRVITRNVRFAHGNLTCRLCNYECPHFLSEQQSFLYRLTIF